MNVTGIIAGVAAILSFALTYYVLGSRTARTRGAFLALFLLLSIPSLLVAAYYLKVLPERAWFYTLRASAGSELLIVFAGCAAGAAATFLPRLLMALPLSGLIAVGAIPYLKPLIMPLADSDFQETWKDGACLQSTSSTCGPASVSTILRRLGGDASEKEAARAAHTYQNGTEAWYLARYVRSKGFKAEFVFKEGFSPEVGLPAVIGVKLGDIGHFIPVLAANGKEVVIADPLQGEERIPMDEFLRRYGFTGFHMVISRP